MMTRDLNFSEGLVNGQRCVLRAVSPNSRVNQAELLTDERPRPIVFIPRINFYAEVGRNGMNFMRIQFPPRTASSMTINKSQGQTFQKIGSDLRSPPFAHGQRHVVLTRAQNRDSIMCLLPPDHVTEGTPYIENVFYPPFIDAANGKSQPPPPNLPPPTLPSLPPLPPSPPTWTVQNKIGDGACGFKAIARRFLGSPELHFQARLQIVQQLANNRQDANLHIHHGMGVELRFRSSFTPCTYFFFDD